MPSIFAELKRRNVYKVAVAYAVVSWLLVQAASILFPTYDAPAWVMKVFVALVVAGFPIALVIAWAFELTPEGIKRAEDAAPTPPRRRRRGVWIAVVVVAALGSIGLFFWNHTASKAEALDKSIAVLPFENLSDDKAN